MLGKRRGCDFTDSHAVQLHDRGGYEAADAWPPGALRCAAPASGHHSWCMGTLPFLWVWVSVCYLVSILVMLHYTYNLLYIIMQCPLSLCQWSTRKEVTFLPNNIIPGYRIYSGGSLCESLLLPDASCVDKTFFVHLNQVLQLRWWKVSHLYKYMAF